MSDAERRIIYLEEHVRELEQRVNCRLAPPTHAGRHNLSFEQMETCRCLLCSYQLEQRDIIHAMVGVR